MAYSTDIVGWWKGENNLEDSSTYGNHAVDGPNPIAYAAGLVGDAFSLSNDEQNPIIASSPSIESMSSGFTAEAWLRFSNDNYNIVFLEKRNGSISYFIRIDDGLGGAGEAGFVVNLNTTGSGTIETTSIVQPLSVATWMHFAFTYDGSNVRYYLNGSLFDTKAAAGGDLVSDPTHNIKFLKGNFNGQADEISLWNRVLSDSEVSDIHSAGASGKDGLPFVGTEGGGEDAPPLGFIPMKGNKRGDNNGIVQKRSDPFSSLEINDNRGVPTDSILSIGGKSTSLNAKFRNGIVE